MTDIFMFQVISMDTVSFDVEYQNPPLGTVTITIICESMTFQ